MTTLRYTIDDIARAAGVSKGTVSRVINGHQTVALRTRHHVQAVMDQFGYAPDPAARQLSWRKGQTLGLSFGRHDPLLSPYHVLFTRALEARTAPQGVQLVNLKHDLASLRSLPNAALVLNNSQDGDERLTLLAELGVPAVLIGHHPASFWVAPDDIGGSRLATEQLTKAGHRALVYLGGGPSQVAQDRESGFLQAAVAAGAQTLTLEADFTLLGGYRAVRRAWESGVRFTGLFAQSDESAVGAVAALEDMGLTVPRDVSVVGFDGLPELALPIKLTTVSQDIERIAECALELMREAVEGLPARGQHIPVRLKLGATVAAPPSSSSVP
ncbi:LacI family transcriptional regulator (plasmid) [Deinococcus psychrotolerans]|uniref:LacI family transcriptional regulator n=1 Tax=Deinococcus psychrotolerans TaxID=2489213 RepID=A0A3G8YGZ9_9DEIO|nr:LacI family DNA-binding transcriptional regulator [Deinococcus psychrotolerans]AZI44599.1 LacI family transcriptional regulator [Deinococcus psychrotolerans]